MKYIVKLHLMFWLGVTAIYAAASADLEQAIENEFLHDPIVDVYQVNTLVEDGRVTLTGEVETLLEKRRAADLASTVLGVIEIRNQLSVVPGVSIEDNAIVEAVNRVLESNPATDEWEILIRSENGRVVLDGRVDSLGESMLAEKLASGVRGVTEIQNNVHLGEAPKRTDEEIEMDIRQLLQWDVRVPAENIVVEVENGHVKLSGSVNSLAAKIRAEIDAGNANAVSVDTRDLKVDPHLKKLSADSELSDADLQFAIRNAMIFSPEVDGSGITVYVKDREVTLMGTVDTLRQRENAAILARNTVGTRSVENQLRIRKTYLSDSSLEELIEQSLADDSTTSEQDITVFVDHSRVRLRGRVDTRMEKIRAESIASGVKGVLSVANDLQVADFTYPLVYNPYVDYGYVNYYGIALESEPPQADEPANDETIRRSIQSELFWSPFVDSDSIAVTVADGVATVRGNVDSLMEMDAVIENSYEGGALYVDNDLVLSNQ